MYSLLTAAAPLAAGADSGRSIDWPAVILILRLCLTGFMVFAAIGSFVHETRKVQITSGQEEAVRNLVDRYEQLAAATMDAEQRIATDIAELRMRASAIEQILRSVE